MKPHCPFYWPAGALAGIRRRILCLLLAIVLCAITASIRAEPPRAATAPARADAPAVRVETADPPASTWREVTFKPIHAGGADGALAAYLALVREEMAKYPSAFLEKSGLTTIYAVHDLAVSGQRRAVVPDFPLGRMYVDPAVGAHAPDYQRHAIHHDFFHFLMGRWEGDAYFKDPQWIALNPPGTTYGAGGVHARGGDQFAMNHPKPGFVNLYSQSAVEEDMAEVFAMLRTEKHRALLVEWAKQDAFLKRKVEYMEAFFQRHSAQEATGAPPPTRPAEDGEAVSWAA